jgi:hypothetical protein
MSPKDTEADTVAQPIGVYGQGVYGKCRMPTLEELQAADLAPTLPSVGEARSDQPSPQEDAGLRHGTGRRLADA